MTEIKICGLTKAEEVEWILQETVAYFGIVLFFPKSRRNVSIEKAKELLAVRRKEERAYPKAVAVTVSPTASQIKEIEAAGFDMIQIHGELSEEVLDAVHLPIIRAFNVTDMEAYEKYHNCPKVAAYLFDAQIPGSGCTFDWKLLENIPRDEKKLFLAGGLNSENVREAIEKVHPDVVDVSSGVETQAVKDRTKIKEFVRKAVTDEQ